MATFGNAFKSLFLDKKARDSLQNRPQQPLAPQPRALKPAPDRHPSPEEIHARLEEVDQAVGNKKSPDRQQLIKEALKIRAAKADVLENLSDEQRNKLHDLAVRSLLSAVREGGDGK